MRVSGNRIIDGLAFLAFIISMTALAGNLAGYTQLAAWDPRHPVMPPVTGSLLVLLSFLLIGAERFLALEIRVDVQQNSRAKSDDLRLLLRITKVSLDQFPKYIIRTVSLTGLCLTGALGSWMSGQTWIGSGLSAMTMLPAPHTLLCLMLLFLASAAATYQKVSSLIIIQVASLAVLVIALSALVGHLLGTHSPVLMGFGGGSGVTVGMALPTSICLLCLGGGYMVNAGRDFFLGVPVKLFSAFGAIALLLISMGGLPVLSGWFIASLDWDRRFGRDSALALLVVVNIFMQLPVILHVARKLFLQEYQLKQAVSSLKEAVGQKDELAAKLLDLSLRDPLTGLNNRRAFEDELRKVWRRGMRAHHPVSLLYVDIDYFKAFNDHYGHPAGDTCLVSVASILLGTVGREGDMVARQGGEEFIMLLPETGLEGALCVAQKLHSLLHTKNIEHARSLVADRVTVSIGIASLLPRRETPAEHLVEEADKALYEAKAGGRNRTFVAPSVST